MSNKKLNLDKVAGGANTEFVYNSKDGKDKFEGQTSIAGGNSTDIFTVVVRPDGSKDYIFTGAANEQGE